MKELVSYLFSCRITVLSCLQHKRCFLYLFVVRWLFCLPETQRKSSITSFLDGKLFRISIDTKAIRPSIVLFPLTCNCLFPSRASNEDSSLLECDIVCYCGQIPTFRRNNKHFSGMKGGDSRMYYSIYTILSPLWSSGQISWLKIQKYRFDSRRYHIF
jgi:hypothetical protein